MISIEEALRTIRKHTPAPKQTRHLPLSKAVGYVLAEDIVSPISMPPFRQSAMDGYAVHLNGGTRYKVIGAVQAGEGAQPALLPGEAVRIFTGAPVPDSANAVVIQEHVQPCGDWIEVERSVELQANIRPLGEQLMQGSIALSKGRRIQPAGVGFLASLGIVEVTVFSQPRIGIVVTGNELSTPGKPLLPGKIYESNSVMLKAQLLRLGYTEVSIEELEDDLEATIGALDRSLLHNDLTIISGGISVGQHDYVHPALEKLGVKEHFYKVHQKPGKPLYFGSRDNKLVFALPGNPAATLSCFYLYVHLALELMMGNADFGIHRTRARSRSTYSSKGDRPQFLKAVYREGEVSILEGQSSAMLHTFAVANALVFKPASVQAIAAGDEVETLLLPSY